MPGADFRLFEGCGHAIQAQDPEKLNGELEQCFKKGEGWK
jgi:pimeloyl-ACP methyl ester carboxylesterase